MQELGDMVPSVNFQLKLSLLPTTPEVLLTAHSTPVEERAGGHKGHDANRNTDATQHSSRHARRKGIHRAVLSRPQGPCVERPAGQVVKRLHPTLIILAC